MNILLLLSNGMSIILIMQTSVDTMEAKTPAVERRKEGSCTRSHARKRTLEVRPWGHKQVVKLITQYKVKSGDPKMEPQCTLMRPSIGLTKWSRCKPVVGYVIYLQGGFQGLVSVVQSKATMYGHSTTFIQFMYLVSCSLCVPGAMVFQWGPTCVLLPMGSPS